MRVLEPHCEWTAGDVADEAEWTVHLTAEERAELDAALQPNKVGAVVFF